MGSSAFTSPNLVKPGIRDTFLKCSGSILIEEQPPPADWKEATRQLLDESAYYRVPVVKTANVDHVLRKPFDKPEGLKLNGDKSVEVGFGERKMSELNVKEHMSHQEVSEMHQKRLARIYDKVLVVEDLKTARKVVNMLTTKYRELLYACDTEASHKWFILCCFLLTALKSGFFG